MKKKMQSLKLNNSGAALVMVIVVISFVSIIATVLLYMSAMNFYMKTTDTKTKASFYSGEKALEEIKDVLMVDSSLAFEKAYNKVMVNYAVSDQGENFQKAFNDEFFSAFETIWKNAAGGGSIPDEDTLAAYLNSVLDTSFQDPSTGLSTVITVGTGTTSERGTEAGGDLDKYYIHNVELSFTDSNNYTTMIKTDFIIQAPAIKFDNSDTTGKPVDMVDCVTYYKWSKE